MLVIGGRDKLQADSGNPAKNYTLNAAGFTCLKQGLFSSMNLNTFKWESSLPSNDGDYELNKEIVSLIGGNSTGGATQVNPKDGWDDAGLQAIMFISVSSTASSTASSTMTTTGATSTSSPKSTPLAAIVGGVVGGVALIALVVIGVMIVIRRTKKKATTITNPAIPPQPPQDPNQSVMYQSPSVPQGWTQQPPMGYIWDPNSQQYYTPVGSPPPQSPGPGGFYGKPEGPDPAEMPTTPIELHG